MPQKAIEGLNQVFLPPWWWRNPPDPGPDWNMLMNSLDKSAITQLAAAQLTFAAKEVEAQKTVLDAKSKALAAMQEIIKGASAK